MLDEPERARRAPAVREHGRPARGEGRRDRGPAPGAADKTEWVSQIRTTSTLFGPYQLQEDAHPNYWGQLALRNCLRQAYNGGAPRGGTCTRGRERPERLRRAADDPAGSAGRPTSEGLTNKPARRLNFWAPRGRCRQCARPHLCRLDPDPRPLPRDPGVHDVGRSRPRRSPRARCIATPRRCSSSRRSTRPWRTGSPTRSRPRSPPAGGRPGGARRRRRPDARAARVRRRVRASALDQVQDHVMHGDGEPDHAGSRSWSPRPPGTPRPATPSSRRRSPPGRR